jgi:hypothetical protein
MVDYRKLRLPGPLAWLYQTAFLDMVRPEDDFATMTRKIIVSAGLFWIPCPAGFMAYWAYCYQTGSYGVGPSIFLPIALACVLVCTMSSYFYARAKKEVSSTMMDLYMLGMSISFGLMCLVLKDYPSAVGAFGVLLCCTLTGSERLWLHLAVDSVLFLVADYNKNWDKVNNGAAPQLTIGEPYLLGPGHLAVTMGLSYGIVFTSFAVFMVQNKEYQSTVKSAKQSVLMARRTAQLLRTYDTESVREVLQEFKEEGFADVDLIEELTTIVDNLDRYKPHIPNWVLFPDGDEPEEDEVETEAEKADTVSSPLAKGTLKRSGPELFADTSSASTAEGADYPRSPNGVKQNIDMLESSICSDGKSQDSMDDANGNIRSLEGSLHMQEDQSSSLVLDGSIKKNQQPYLVTDDVKRASSNVRRIGSQRKNDKLTKVVATKGPANGPLQCKKVTLAVIKLHLLDRANTDAVPLVAARLCALRERLTTAPSTSKETAFQSQSSNESVVSTLQSIEQSVGSSSSVQPTAAEKLDEMYAAPQLTDQYRHRMNKIVEICHALAKETQGALHSFINDKILISWNATNSVAQPEVKACRFLRNLQLAIDEENRSVLGQESFGCPLDANILRSVKMSAAVVTQQAACFLAGAGFTQAFLMHNPGWAHWIPYMQQSAQEGHCYSILVDKATMVGAKYTFRLRAYEAIRIRANCQGGYAAGSSASTFSVLDAEVGGLAKPGETPASIDLTRVVELYELLGDRSEQVTEEHASHQQRDQPHLPAAVDNNDNEWMYQLERFGKDPNEAVNEAFQLCLEGRWREALAKLQGLLGYPSIASSLTFNRLYLRALAFAAANSPTRDFPILRM